MARLPVARIEVKEYRDEEYWEAICTCGAGEGSALAIECLEWALAHYAETPHRGYLYIDVKPEAVNAV